MSREPEPWEGYFCHNPRYLRPPVSYSTFKFARLTTPLISYRLSAWPSRGSKQTATFALHVRFGATTYKITFHHSGLVYGIVRGRHSEGGCEVVGQVSGLRERYALGNALEVNNRCEI